MSYLGGTPYWLCQSRVSMTLLLKATLLYSLAPCGREWHDSAEWGILKDIDIATAMTLWIPRHGTSCREYRRRMTMKVAVLRTRLPAFFTPQLSTSFYSASCRFIGRGSLENPWLCCCKQRILTLPRQWSYGYSPASASRVWQQVWHF